MIFIGLFLIALLSYSIFVTDMLCNSNFASNHLQGTIVYCIYVYVNYYVYVNCSLLYHILYIYYSVNM